MTDDLLPRRVLDCRWTITAGLVLLACGGACQKTTQTAVLSSNFPVPSSPSSPSQPAPSALSDSEAPLLAAWYVAVGPRRPAEAFGDLVVRVAATQLDKPYFDAPWSPGEEVLRCELTSFQCVSLVESSLALGRCVWRQDATSGCFLRELQGLRYRDGLINGYPSRLHYYEDWLSDNARRGHLQIITEALGGTPSQIGFSFMTTHPDKYPALGDLSNRREIAAAEARLSRLPIAILPRARVAAAEAMLRSGDVIAIAGSKPGIVISHTGFISRDAHGVAHLLHASSLRKKVVLTDKDLAEYLMHGGDRRGILVARPLPP